MYNIPSHILLVGTDAHGEQGLGRPRLSHADQQLRQVEALRVPQIAVDYRPVAEKL